MPDGVTLPPDELVYRRIAENSGWVQGGMVSFAAFLPNAGDVHGLSLSRLSSAQEACATGLRGKRYYAVRIRVGDLYDQDPGTRVIGDDPTHAVIEGWTRDRRDDPGVRALANFLTTVCGVPEGPFEGRRDPPQPREPSSGTTPAR